jgi:spore coat polysaccharide biosynthesis predicted glycosyltransferase SpsG
MKERGHETYWCGWWQMPDPSIQYDVAVYDGYWEDPQDVLAVIATWKNSQPDTKLVYISDDHHSYQPFDLVVNGSPGSCESDYSGSGAAKALAGPEYALLRKLFRHAHDEIIQYSASERDRHRHLFDAREIQGWSESLVVTLMRSAPLVITWGGMRALEAACVGAPMICVEVNELNFGESNNIFGLWRAGAAYWWLGCELSHERTLAAVSKLMQSKETLHKMSDAGLALVDGMGTMRVSDEIERMVS